MQLDTTISISFILSVLSAVGVVFSIYNTTRSAREAQEKKELGIEKNFVKVNLKLDNLCDSVGAIKTAQQRTDESLGKINEVLTRHDERIVILESRVNHLEGREE